MAFLSNTTTKCSLSFFLLFLNFFFYFSFSQSNSPQNIETFYPPTPPPPPPSLPPAPSPSPVIPPPVIFSPPPTPPSYQYPPPSTSRKPIYTAIGVTAASTLVVAAVVFFLFARYSKRKKQNGGGTVHAVSAVAAGGGGGGGGGGGRLQPLAAGEFTRFDGNIKGLIVDEDGLDVLYWRKLEGNSQRKSGPFHKDVFGKASNNGRKVFSRGKSSSSNNNNNQIYSNPKDDQTVRLLDPKPTSEFDANSQSVENVKVSENLVANNSRSVGNGKVSENLVTNNSRSFGNVKASENLVTNSRSVGNVKVSENLDAPPPPPPAPAPPPPPPPPVGVKKGPGPPPPPPIGGKKGPAPPPPPPIKGGGSSRPPQPPKRTPSGNVVESLAIGDEGSGSNNDQVKLKPLHWEKVNVNTDHSMVWDKIERGSFQYNGDMMEALFGYVAVNRKSPKEETSTQESNKSTSTAPKISILDSRRSQNILIVVRSIGITRNELIDGLQEGRGLTIDVLEKLTRITPSKEEKIEILGFNGDPTKLADAESFLFHLLKAIPSAFTRANTMLFRYTYGSEINQLKESLQTLDSACNELRSRGVFLKLLEAILKAGNRLNAGTSRGDAKAFNLTALRKLSDYKSSDGKTTLLHFVVHEVVRNEGRRCVMNRNNSLSRTNSQRSSGSGPGPKPEETKSKDEQEREFLQLGLPVVGGLSAEFSNVKKAATLDYDTIVSIGTQTRARVAETRELVLQCGADEKGREFVREMKEFLGAAEGEIKVVQEEQIRVMEYVKKTTQYYQAGGFKDKQPLQLFVIVKDFLDTVDKTCIDIARSLQQKKLSNTTTTTITTSVVGSSSSSNPNPNPNPNPDVLRTRVTFPRLPRNFLSDKSSGSESDEER